MPSQFIASRPGYAYLFLRLDDGRQGRLVGVDRCLVDVVALDELILDALAGLEGLEGAGGGVVDALGLIGTDLLGLLGELLSCICNERIEVQGKLFCESVCILLCALVVSALSRPVPSHLLLLLGDANTDGSLEVLG